MNNIKSKSFKHTTAAGLLTIVAMSVLTACGGGSSTATDTAAAATPSAPVTATTPAANPALAITPANQFVGVHITNCETDGTKSSIGTATFRKTAENVFEGETSANVYVGTACAGTPTKSASLTNMRMTIVGTKVVGGLTVQKIMGTATEGVGKFIMYSSGYNAGDFIQIGVEAPKDADGYPEQLNPYKFILR
jgi:hypothetical protein